ncbi:MAG: hypothetical protein J6X28_03945 [Bacilli bacterium]|nr:hypothetical protein [Bacilli bacterium]
MRKRDQIKERNFWMGAIILLTIAIIAFLIFSGTSRSETDKELGKDGYTTTEEDAFYKKIVTNNTLDSYYNDVANNHDSEYEEYYLQKDSLTFLELKMKYYNMANTTLSFTSSLRENTIEYNFEYSYKESHLILEGNSDSNYECQIVVRKNVNDQEAKKLCDYIMNEINIFEVRRNNILQNSKVQELLNQPITEYVEE